MTDWHLAQSLVALRNEINKRWPNRDKTSDGSIGDASHQARKSDHNPDWDAGGVVRAIDVDKDGIDVQALLNATIGDSRVWYVIWDHHIYSRTYGWAKRAYDGSNPHTKHVHISINHTRTAETNTAAWFEAAPPKEEFELTAAQYKTLTDQMNDVLAEVKACRRDVRDYALWEVLYDLETEDERMAAEAAFDAARAAGQSVTDAKVAAMRALNPLVQDIKAAKAGK